MFNQKRIYRVFQLINYLKAPPAKPIKSIMKFLGTSERTVYRYIDLLAELGFQIKKDPDNRLWIDSKSTSFTIFTPQESSYLEKLILSSGKQSKLAESTLYKIQQSSEHHIGADNLYRAHLAQIVATISEAIAQGKQLLIKSYASAHSQSITDRIVEPVAFTDNYISLCAFEPKSKENKYFNIERMGSVLMSNRKMKYQHLHAFHKPDVFGFQGKNMNKEISLQLNLRAMLILRESYPMSSPYILQETEGTYLFTVQVQSFTTPAKFVLGMQPDVVIRGSTAFKRFVETLRTKYQEA
jgi:predicted DNA-binding transcriptional regulator YafY